jgi:hypothetical protein
MDWAWGKEAQFQSDVVPQVDLDGLNLNKTASTRWTSPRPGGPHQDQVDLAKTSGLHQDQVDLTKTRSTSPSPVYVTKTTPIGEWANTVFHDRKQETKSNFPALTK